MSLTFNGRFIVAGVLLGAALLLAGCGSKEERAAKHLSRANSFYQEGKFPEAEIEYKNVMRLDRTNATAIARLGVIYHDQGRLLPAVQLLRGARELLPDDLEARLRLGLALLAGHRSDEAREEAMFILSKNPKNEEALVLLADTARNSNDIATVAQELERLRPQAEQTAGYQLAWSNLYFRQGKTAETEAALKKALLLAPKSAPVHAALGNFYWAQNNLPEAERFLSAATELAPPRSSWALRYADFKIRNKDLAGGKAILTKLTEQTPDYLAPWARLADLAFVEKDYDTCNDYVKKILEQDPTNYDAILLAARVRMAKGEAKEAVDILTRMKDTFSLTDSNQVTRTPGPVLYQLALAQMMNQDRAAALANLNQALTQDTNYVEAAMLKANLSMQSGEPRGIPEAIDILKRVIEIDPRQAQARLLLANAYRQQGNLDAALKVYDEVIALYPDNPQMPFLKGILYLQQRNTNEARQSFTVALDKNPKFVLALEQLINMDLMNKDYTTALERLDKELQTNPDNATAVHLLRGKVYYASGDLDKAEASINKTLELSPNLQAAHNMLVRLYIAGNKHQEALKNLKAMAEANPNNKSVLIRLGMIYDALKNQQEAQRVYEEILDIDPNYVPALNNLAYLYSEYANDLDKAYELARKARDLVPEDPFAADTLGWIVLKRGDYRWALSLLTASAERMSTEPEVLYHLGMAQYMNGQEKAARDTLQRALQGDAKDFPGRDQIATRLSYLNLDPATADAETVTALEKAAEALPGDPVVCARLAVIYERKGDDAKAAQFYEQIRTRNPRIPEVLINLARLYAHKLNDPGKAQERAKEARDLAPNDPEAAYTLGRLAFESGDTKWSLSLLQEGARQLSDRADVLYDYARALYSQGRLAEAKSNLDAALQKNSNFSRATEAAEFQTMLDLALNPEKAGTAAAQVQQILAQKPQYAPALYVAGLIHESTDNAGNARSAYESILKIPGYDGFAPAHKRLAILLVEKLNDADAAYPHGMAAREALPQDPAVAKVLGIISFKRNDAARAAQLLAEASRSLSADAEVFYWLGKAQFQLKQNAPSAESLRRALALNANAPFAADAQQILSQLQ